MGKRTNVAVWLKDYKRWQIKVQKDSKRRTFYSSTPGRRGKEECHRKADEWLDDGIESGVARVRDVYASWLEDIEIRAGTSSYKQYEMIGRLYILPAVGNIRMGDLSEQDLQNVLNGAAKRSRDKTLSRKTLSNIRACISTFLRFGRKSRLTKLVIEELVIPSKAPVGERQILQPSDLKTLFSVDTVTMRGQLQYDVFINAYRFEVVTGLRPGELIGLKWTDVRGDVLHVRRSFNVHNEQTRGKNDNANRIIPLMSLSSGILNQQKLKMIELGIRSEYVFPDASGNRVPQITYAGRWRRYRDENGLPPVTLYELRHTFVSIVKQLPEGQIKPIVGHSKSMDTFGVYGHQFSGELQATAGQIQSIFSGYLTDEEDEEIAKSK